MLIFILVRSQFGSRVLCLVACASRRDGSPGPMVWRRLVSSPATVRHGNVAIHVRDLSSLSVVLEQFAKVTLSSSSQQQQQNQCFTARRSSSSRSVFTVRFPNSLGLLDRLGILCRLTSCSLRRYPLPPRCRRLPA